MAENDTVEEESGSTPTEDSTKQPSEQEKLKDQWKDHFPNTGTVNRSGRWDTDDIISRKS